MICLQDLKIIKSIKAEDSLEYLKAVALYRLLYKNKPSSFTRNFNIFSYIFILTLPHSCRVQGLGCRHGVHVI